MENDKNKEYHTCSKYPFEVYTLNYLCLYIHNVMAKIGFICIRSGIDENDNNKVYYEGNDNNGNKMRIEFIKNKESK